MSLPELCIRRPVFATVLSLLLLLVGIVSYQRLAVREYPSIDQPVVSVVTSYPGASPEIMESQVTQVLEASIAGIHIDECRLWHGEAEGGILDGRLIRHRRSDRRRLIYVGDSEYQRVGHAQVAHIRRRDREFQVSNLLIIGSAMKRPRRWIEAEPGW